MRRRAANAAIACATFVAFAAPAQTAAPTKIAVLTMIGDEITIDEYVGQTGTSMDGLSRETIPVTNAVFDNTALLAAQDALMKLSPTMRIATLTPAQPGSLNDPAKLITNGKVDSSHPLVSALRREGYGQLLVISKLRARAVMTVNGESAGNGHIKGLGFYIDRKYESKKDQPGEAAVGFIAPYAYLKLSVVDIGLLTVVREREITLDRPQSEFASMGGGTPWNWLTPEQKTRVLRELVANGIATAVPQLVVASQ